MKVVGNLEKYASSVAEGQEQVRSTAGTEPGTRQQQSSTELQTQSRREGRTSKIEQLMVSSPPSSHRIITRRSLFKAGVCGIAGLAVYGVEIDRHWLEITPYEVYIPGLPAEFEGFRALQLSDIHIDEFTEPYFVREAVDHINRLAPDAIFITGDFVTHQLFPKKFAEGSAWQCANILSRLQCPRRFAIFGNHDVLVGEKIVGTALEDNGIPVIRNSHVPLERGKARIWLAGVDDPVMGHPDPDAAIPESIRNRPNEPVILLCHAPDYADRLLRHPAGQSVALMLSGHTHGGQIHIPFLPLMHLPPLGRKYVEGWFKLESMQLHVNRGLGTVGVPVRFDCAPQLSLLTLRSGSPVAPGAGRLG